MNNQMQLIQILTQLKNSPNPQQAMMSLFGGNPQFQQAMQLAQGNSEQQLMGLVQQVCQQRGVDFNALMQLLKGV